MTISEAIQQRTFSSEYQKAHINVLYTAAWLSGRTNEILRPYNLSWQQFNILRILRGLHPEPASVKLLIERMIDKNSNASRLVDKLLLKELVDRKVCEDDRRQVDIYITVKGLQVLGEISAKLEEQFLFNTQELSPAEAALLSDLLDKMRS